MLKAIAAAARLLCQEGVLVETAASKNYRENILVLRDTVPVMIKDTLCCCIDSRIPCCPRSMFKHISEHWAAHLFPSFSISSFTLPLPTHPLVHRGFPATVKCLSLASSFHGGNDVNELFRASNSFHILQLQKRRWKFLSNYSAKPPKEVTVFSNLQYLWATRSNGCHLRSAQTKNSRLHKLLGTDVRELFCT